MVWETSLRICCILQRTSLGSLSSTPDICKTRGKTIATDRNTQMRSLDIGMCGEERLFCVEGLWLAIAKTPARDAPNPFPSLVTVRLTRRGFGGSRAGRCSRDAPFERSAAVCGCAWPRPISVLFPQQRLSVRPESPDRRSDQTPVHKFVFVCP